MPFVDLQAKKKCGKCSGKKSVFLFSRSTRMSDGRAGYCKSCMQGYMSRYSKYRTEWNQRNWSSVTTKAREAHLRRAYGMKPEDFDGMLLRQSGRCAICNEPMRRVDIDHNHTTGVVRELLCHMCNVALGAVRERADTLTSMLRYVEKHGKCPGGALTGADRAAMVSA